MEEEKIIFRYEMPCGGITGLFLPPTMSVKIINRTENNVLLYEFKNDLNNTTENMVTLPYDVIKEVIELIKESDVVFSFDSKKLYNDVEQNIENQHFSILDSNGEVIEFNDDFRSFCFCSDISYVDRNLTFELETVVSLVEKISKLLDKNGIDVERYLPLRFTKGLTEPERQEYLKTIR